MAASGADRLDDNNRIFETISSQSIDITVDGLTLTGGRTSFSFQDGAGAITVTGVNIFDVDSAASDRSQAEDPGTAIDANACDVTENAVCSNGGRSDLGAFELQGQPPTVSEFTSPNFVSVAENLTFVIDVQAVDRPDPKAVV